MDKLTYLALDVHKETTAVALLRPGDREPDSRTIPTTKEAYRKLIGKVGAKDLAACYEAGPCGYDPYRTLAALGVRCSVIAPSLIPRRPGDRVKTDRLDARNLARLHRAGQLTEIRVPSLEEEAIRDLIRVREDLKDDRRIAVQRIKSFLLRNGKPFPGRKGFNDVQQSWASGLRFDQLWAQESFDQLMAAFQTRNVQLKALDKKIEQLAADSPISHMVGPLRALKGIDTLSAATIAAEVCDFRQFPNAPAFMGFTGLVPSEHSSGERTRRGSITKAGNPHLRRVLVEAAWAYRHRPAVGYALRRRQEGQSAEVIAYSWKVQQRLHQRFAMLSAKKGANKAVTAVARELAGFVWGLMNERHVAKP